MIPLLLTPTQPANKEVRDRSLRIGGEVIKSQLPSNAYELMIDLVSMSKGMFPVDVGKAVKVLSKNFKGPGGPKGTGLVPVPVGGPSLKAPTSTSTIDPSVPLQIASRTARLPKTGISDPPKTKGPILEKAKREGFSERRTLTPSRQIAEIIREEGQLTRAANLLKPETADEVLALSSHAKSTYLTGFKRLPKELQERILYLRELSGEKVHLHHWNPKMVDAKRKLHMVKLVNEGKATRDDIRLLDFVLESRKEPGGGIWKPGGTQTLGAMPETFHQGVHARYQAAGLEKKWNWGAAVQKELDSIDNPTALIEHAIEQRENMLPTNLKVKYELLRLYPKIAQP